MTSGWEAPIGPEDIADILELVGPQDTGAGPHSLTETTNRLGPAERVERLAGALRRRRVDRDLQKALLVGAGEGLRKAAGEARPALTLRDAIGLEAVILTDGTRPSLRVRSAFVDVESIEASEWSHDLRRHEDAIRRVIAATGKVCAPVAGGFAGSAVVVADDVVITNRHVAELIAVQHDGGWSLRWPGQLAIDFVAEELGGPPPEWDVVEIAFAGPEEIGALPSLAKLDIAMLRCRPRPGAQARSPIDPDRGDGVPALLAADRAVFAVGVPARPQRWSGEGKPPPRHEIDAVIGGIFEDIFGVKRLAPGRIKRLPETLPSGNGRVFSHDCSTLGGNSGSAVGDLDLNGTRVIGLHFGGSSRSANYAHGFAAIRADLPPGIALRWGDAGG